MGFTEVDGAHILKMSLRTAKKKWSENYPMLTTDFDTAVKQGNMLSWWRAAILGRGAVLTKAVVTKLGKKKNSRSATDVEIPGSIGVKFEPTSDWGTVDMSINTGCSGLRFRYERSTGEHVIRAYRAIPDKAIHAEEYALGDPIPSIVDLGDYSFPADADLASLPKKALWDPAATYTDAEKAEFATFATALKNVLNFSYNWLAHWTIVKVDATTKTVTQNPFTKIFYRGVTDRFPSRRSALS